MCKTDSYNSYSIPDSPHPRGEAQELDRDVCVLGLFFLSLKINGWVLGWVKTAPRQNNCVFNSCCSHSQNGCRKIPWPFPVGSIQIPLLTAVCPWASCLTSLSITFIFRMGVGHLSSQAVTGPMRREGPVSRSWEPHHIQLLLVKWMNGPRKSLINIKQSMRALMSDTVISWNTKKEKF